MSVQMMGAVINCGPQDRTQFCVMMALANYADDFGFAYPSIETIAANSRCDMRTTRRQISNLEAEGWLYCARKAVGGKSNAYILNIGKIGVTVPPNGKRSPLFLKLYKSLGVTMTPIFAPEKSEGTVPPEHLKNDDFDENSEDIGDFSEDNPQPLTGQDEQSQRTFEGGSEDIACPPNRYNRQEPSGTVSLEPPTLPSRGEGAVQTPSPAETGPDPGKPAARPWPKFIAALKSQMYDIPIGVETGKRWKQVKNGEHDFVACFSGWWLEQMQRNSAGITFVTFAEDEAATEAGIAKYRKRLTRLLGEFFDLPKNEPVSFKVLRAEEAQKTAPVPHWDRGLTNPAPDAGLEAALSHSGTEPAERPLSNGEIPASDREAWEQVQRLAKEHLERIAKMNPGIRREWIEQAVEPAELESVEGVNGKRLWKLRSPAPETTRVVINLLGRQAIRKVAGEVEIVVVGPEGESP